MTNNFNLNLNGINSLSAEEKKYREDSLKLFYQDGFPNKKKEEWKFTDYNKIINDNFESLESKKVLQDNIDINIIKDFEHNYIIIANGFYSSKKFTFEDESKFKVLEFKENFQKTNAGKNSLINLNNALSQSGYFLEVGSNYKFKKPLIVYNIFSDKLENTIINNKNSVILNENSELNIVELNIGDPKSKFIQNNFTNIKIKSGATLKNFTIQGNKSNGFFYKYIKGELKDRSNYEDYIFSSGLKFNKIEEEINIDGEKANCTIQSGLFLNFDNQQEIKTHLNHMKPDCTSHQTIKNVLNKNCKSTFQGKIFVKDIAQKTNAYQLSKALILSDSSEFNAKPELEIYADDVKCSHGSTSGSINEDSIYYLMTRGISRKNAIELLTKAFLFEVTNSIVNKEIKNFIEKNVDRQIYGY